MQKKSQTLFHVLFWGSLWGITEATVGYALHLLPAGIGWVFWYPIAFAFLSLAYHFSRSDSAVMLTACFAAGIKLLNLLTGMRPDRVVNPAVSMLLEAAGFLIACRLVQKLSSRSGWMLRSIGANLIWRVGYLYYLLCVPDWMFEISAYSSRGAMAGFLVRELLVTGAIVLAAQGLCRLAARRVSPPVWRLGSGAKLAVAFGVAAVNLAMQFL
ncbi:hypothetical protein [Feifania hominis]|uniref:Uncharacterized protein n=1 Tax=Feifania hominis TaxID=2763660 RepID=A0A926DCS4_9FIRM|nr:hypothetical protein [Feifania hominis]MBC8535816.1 hypothetical protein [Feifania hominis]